MAIIMPGCDLSQPGDPDQRVIGMATHGEFDAVGDDFARRQRGLHAGMTHGDTVGHGDGAELARRGAAAGDALFHRLRLAHQGNVAGGRFVPAGRDADERLVDLLGGQTHRVIESAMWRAVRPLSGVPARQFRLQTGLGVHGPCRPARITLPGGPPASFEAQPASKRATMWLNGMAESRRQLGRSGPMLKCCRSVANRLQVRPNGITRIFCRGARVGPSSVSL